MMKLTVGDRIRKARQKKGWTQEEVHYRSGVTRAQQSRIECGKAKPTFETVCRIAKALDIPVEELWEYEEPYANRLARRLSSTLTPEQVEKVKMITQLAIDLAKSEAIPAGSNASTATEQR